MTGKLEAADLIQRKSGGIYERITDPVLADYIVREYQTNVLSRSLNDYHAEFNVEFRRHLGNITSILGEAAELYPRHLLLNFTGQTVDAGEIVGHGSGKIILSEIRKVERRCGLVTEGDIVEFDLIAEGTEQWLVEVTY